jgi:hypothetical protein
VEEKMHNVSNLYLQHLYSIPLDNAISVMSPKSELHGIQQYMYKFDNNVKKKKAIMAGGVEMGG